MRFQTVISCSGEIAALKSRDREVGIEGEVEERRERLSDAILDAYSEKGTEKHQNNDPGSVFHTRARIDRVGVCGHSVGGLSAILAAALDMRIRAVSTMDSVENSGLGVAVLPGISAPEAISNLHLMMENLAAPRESGECRFSWVIQRSIHCLTECSRAR